MSEHLHPPHPASLQSVNAMHADTDAVMHTNLATPEEEERHPPLPLPPPGPAAAAASCQVTPPQSMSATQSPASLSHASGDASPVMTGNNGTLAVLELGCKLQASSSHSLDTASRIPARRLVTASIAGDMAANTPSRQKCCRWRGHVISCPRWRPRWRPRWQHTLFSRQKRCRWRD